MALESVTHISDLVQTNPASTDPASQGDDHIRNIKKALKNTFASITGPVTASHTELSFVKGVTSSIQNQIDVIKQQVGNLVAETVNIVAGRGLSGSPNQSGDYSVNLGTPSTLSATSVNTVSDNSHTHEIGPSIARSAITIAAGTGLTGGGDLTANRTLSVDSTVVRDPASVVRDPSTVVRNSRQVVAGDGLSGGGDLSANRTLSVNNTVVRTGRTITAGAGLTGGGDMTANRTLAMGTPSSITVSSTNSVTAGSHTHELPPVAARAIYANGISPNAIGVPCLMRFNGTGTLGPNDNVLGSSLMFSNASGDNVGGEPAGTWKCLGLCRAGTNADRTTLFIRIL